MRGTICALVALLASSTSQALQCPVITGGNPALGQVDAQTRIEFIRGRLLADGEHSGKWWRGWLIGYSALEAALLTGGLTGSFAPNPPRDTPAGVRAGTIEHLLWKERANLYDGAATTFVGIVTLLISPAHSAFDGPAFDLSLRNPVTDPCAALALGEKYLLNDAQDELVGHHWLIHIGNAALNIAAGLVLGIFFHDWVSGVATAIVGAGVGEAMIWTEPNGAQDALKQYRTGDLSPPAQRVQLEVVGPSLALRF
jgi:hypothetical protein